MKLSFDRITNATCEEWDKALESCPHATYFHSRDWSEIWQRYDGLVPYAKKIEFSDGKSMILPCSYYPSKKGLIKSIIMSPGGNYGGALYDEGISIDHLKLVTHEIRKFQLFTWRRNPYEPLIQYLWPVNSEEDTTYIIDLSPGFESIYKEWTRGNSSACKKAQRLGVIVREGNSEKDWLEYYMAYEDTLRRWGNKAARRYGWQLFQILYEWRSVKIKLWIAEFDGRLIAGAICFYQNRHVVCWHNASYEQYFNLRPVNLLYSEMIKKACESEYKWYDFNPSEHLEGVEKFKKSFGSKPYRCSVWNYESASTKALRLIKGFYTKVILDTE